MTQDSHSKHVRIDLRKSLVPFKMSGSLRSDDGFASSHKSDEQR